MAINRKIKRIGRAILWTLLGMGVFILLGAAVKVKYEKRCGGYTIDIEGPATVYFLSKADVEAILTANGAYAINGRPVSSFNLKQLEERIERNSWVEDAELFFDNQNQLNVSIIEKEPVVRIFNAQGLSFYADKKGELLPLSENCTAKVPVFTGFLGDMGRITTADSLLVHDMVQLASILEKDAFWKAQIAQISILSDHRFELIPMVGDHIIEWGTVADSERKLKRLTAFYQQVIPQVGIRYYKRINVQYVGQVIGVKAIGEEAVADERYAASVLQQLILTSEAEQQRMLQSDTLLMPAAKQAVGTLQQSMKLKALQDSIQQPGLQVDDDMTPEGIGTPVLKPSVKQPIIKQR